MPRLELFEPDASHVPELAAICFEAFGQLHDRHGVPRDFPDLETAGRIIGLFMTHPGFLRTAARLDGRVVGSNFLSVMDEAGGVGPITIAPGAQGHGVGRALMNEVGRLAEKRGMKKVRLIQESINTTSLPLYASLGYAVREAVALMSITPATAGDESVRLATPEDQGALDQLGRRHYKVSRVGEIAAWAGIELPAFVREREGRLRGYFVPGKLGHGVTETVEDALALIGQAGRAVPAEFRSFLCPLRQHGLFAAALRSGHRLDKTVTLMSLGPYEEPEGVWMPSFMY